MSFPPDPNVTDPPPKTAEAWLRDGLPNGFGSLRADSLEVSGAALRECLD